MNHADALAIARKYQAIISPWCDRIEIAGSIRRGKTEVRDIELVVIPKSITEMTLFEVAKVYINVIQALDYKSVWMIKNGPRYKQLRLPEGIDLDLFIVTPPAQWGVIFTTRTGPAEFSRWLVTQRRKGGCMPHYASQRNGCVYLADKPVHMPEESDYLQFLGLDWSEPGDRKAQWGRAPVLRSSTTPVDMRHNP